MEGDGRGGWGLGRVGAGHVQHNFFVLRLEVTACVLIGLFHPLNDSTESSDNQVKYFMGASCKQIFFQIAYCGHIGAQSRTALYE